MVIYLNDAAERGFGIPWGGCGYFVRLTAFV